MNKKLLAAALGVAFAAPVFADSSNLVIYGRVHQQLDHQSSETGNAQTGGSFVIRDVSSRLGFKGSEDLGGGLSAIFGYEFSVAADNNTGVGGRNSGLGFKGNFGKVVVGRQDGGGITESPVYSQASWIGSVSNNGGTLTTVGGGGTAAATGNAIVRTQRLANAVSYAGKFGGVNVAARHALTGTNNNYNTGVPAAGVKEGGTRETEITADYSIGGLKIGGGLQMFDQSGNNPTTGPENLVQLVAKYSLGNLTLAGLVSRTNLYGPTVAGADDTNTDGAISAMYKLSGNSGVFAMYASSERNDLASLAPPPAGPSKIDIDQWQVAAYYDFSKRTRTYVGFNRLSSDPAVGATTDTDNFTVGMRHNF